MPDDNRPTVETSAGKIRRTQLRLLARKILNDKQHELAAAFHQAEILAEAAEEDWDDALDALHEFDQMREDLGVRFE